MADIAEKNSSPFIPLHPSTTLRTSGVEREGKACLAPTKKIKREKGGFSLDFARDEETRPYGKIRNG